MNHPLFVGHFDETVRSFKPKLKKRIDPNLVRNILIKYCDKGSDGEPIVNNTFEDSESRFGQDLGKINHESVVLRDGYLQCPWISSAINSASVTFIADLYLTLGVQIYDPGDGVYFSPEKLAEIERNYYQAPDIKPKLM